MKRRSSMMRKCTAYQSPSTSAPVAAGRKIFRNERGIGSGRDVIDRAQHPGNAGNEILIVSREAGLGRAGPREWHGDLGVNAAGMRRHYQHPGGEKHRLGHRVRDEERGPRLLAANAEQLLVE